jgi:hypothetical protein
VLAVDASGGPVRAAGALPAALSDLAAAAFGGRLWVVGGRDARGAAREEVLELQAPS